MGKSRIYVHVPVEIADVFAEIEDEDLLEEVDARGLGEKAFAGDRRADLVRALGRHDWPEVNYLLRTYFLRDECRHLPVAATPDSLVLQ